MTKLKPIISWTPGVYDHLSRNYDRFAKWFFPIGDVGREAVVSGLDSGQILDVACGTGTLLHKAEKAGLRCYGIDTSRGMLLETRKKVPTAGVVQASFYALPFTEGQFDFVVETNAVSGTGINAVEVLREMLRVCAGGGELRIGDYGRSKREGWWMRILETVGILIGDYPHDYDGILSSLGYQVEVEELGWSGMYQFIRVKR
jgi:ubiquinone/menaquinone biosynthesis C-methylase UbiE